MAYQDPLATSAVSSVNSIANLLNLIQLYPVHPCKNYTLDLCFSDSDYLKVLHSDNAMDLIPCDEHHISAYFEYNDFFFNNHKHFEKFFLYNSIDVDKFNYLISKFDFSFLNIFDLNSCNIDIDFIINKFCSLLYSAISQSVPIHYHTLNEFPSWYDIELIKLIYDKKQIHRLWCCTGEESDYNDFKFLRALCKTRTRFLYNLYLTNIQNSIKSNI